MSTLALVPVHWGIRDRDILAADQSRRLGLAMVGLDPHIEPLYDDYDYARTLFTYAHSCDQLLIVEHDIRPGPWTIGPMLSCRHEACSTPYDCGTLEQPVISALRYLPGTREAVRVEEGEEWAEAMSGLGCVKYAGRALAAIRTYLSATLPSWNRLDGGISNALRSAGIAHHLHWPKVEHRRYT